MGGCFLSTLIYELYRLLGITKINTTAYHPQSDGMVERLNRTLIAMLSKTAREDPRTWDLRLPYVLFAYRTSPHESTQATPFKLMFGREALLPTDELLVPPGQCRELFVGTYIDELMERMSDAWRLARENIAKAQARQKKNFDKRAREPQFEVGDRVMLHMPATKTGPLRKFALPNQGPYQITRKTDNNVFVVPENNPHAKERCVAWEQIRKCPKLSTNPAKEVVEEAETEEIVSGDHVEEPTTGSQRWVDRLRPRNRKMSATRTSSQRRGRCNIGQVT